MSTHFRPRPPTATPSSPVRPSTARTVRAVTPSPPDSLDKAFRTGIAHSGTPARPKSEGFVGASSIDVGGKGDAEELNPFAKYVLSAEGAGFNNLPADVQGSGLRRGGVASGRSSPAKPRSRSGSPKKRPFSTPTRLPSHQKSGSNDKEEAGKETDDGEELDERDEDEEEHEFPDTPTPMTRAQQRSAYVPLGAPLLPEFKREQVDGMEVVHARSRPVSGILATARTYGPTLAAPRTSTFVFHPETPSPQHPQFLEPQFPTHGAPPQVANRAVPRKPIPLSGPGKHISVSGQSNISTGTAASHRSIFSTPGRDELERKKAMVEPDEGPFARAASVADLVQSRRMVSEGRRNGRKADSDGKAERKSFCGLGCNVM